MKTWFTDMRQMHGTYGVSQWVHQARQNDPEKLKKFLEFRMNFLKEEYEETQKAYREKDAEEIIDGLIDICVIAIGTLEAFGVDGDKAWREVHRANMNKEVGVKPSRPNPLGLPDLIKPEGWIAPSHKDNHGNLSDAF